MDGKIKMPEKMARQLAENIYAMQFFDSLSTKEKKEFISNYQSNADLKGYTDKEHR